MSPRVLLSVLGVLSFTLLPDAATAETRFEFGPQLAFPVPSADVGNTELGIDAGVAATLMDKANAGFGLDIAYHYWPASKDFQDHVYSPFQFIDSETWAFSALQTTLHVKALLPEFASVVPWLQGGGGLYRVDPNLVRPDGTREKAEWTGGAYLSVGFDRAAGPGLRLGLDATLHGVAFPGAFHPTTFKAFTVGMHVLFGH